MYLFASTDGRWGAGVEAKRVLTLAVGLDLAILRLEAVDILPHRVEQELEMLRRHDNAGMDARSWHSGSYASKVNDKLGGGVGDDREVGINSLCLFFAEFDLKLLLDWRCWWIVFWHVW